MSVRKRRLAGHHAIAALVHLAGPLLDPPEDLGRQVDEELPLLLHKNALGVVGHRRWGLQLGRHRDRVLHQRAAVVLGRHCPASPERAHEARLLQHEIQRTVSVVLVHPQMREKGAPEHQKLPREALHQERALSLGRTHALEHLRVEHVVEDLGRPLEIPQDAHDLLLLHIKLDRPLDRVLPFLQRHELGAHHRLCPLGVRRLVDREGEQATQRGPAEVAVRSLPP